MAGVGEQSETRARAGGGTRPRPWAGWRATVRDSVLVNPEFSSYVRKKAKRPIWGSDVQPRPRLIELRALLLCRP